MEKALIHFFTQLVWFAFGVVAGILIVLANAWDFLGGLVVGMLVGIFIENDNWDF